MLHPSWGAAVKPRQHKQAYWVPSNLPPPSIVGRYRYPDGPCSAGTPSRPLFRFLWPAVRVDEPETTHWGRCCGNAACLHGHIAISAGYTLCNGGVPVREADGPIQPAPPASIVGSTSTSTGSCSGHGAQAGRRQKEQKEAPQVDHPTRLFSAIESGQLL